MIRDVEFYTNVFRSNKTNIDLLNEYCVYVLWDKSTIVYVGQSTQVDYRIRTHLKNKVFDSYSVYKCEDVAVMNELESNLIVELQPKYNIKIGSGYESVSKIRERIKNINDDYRYSSDFYINKLKKKIKEAGIETVNFNGSVCIKKTDVKRALEYILEG